jgi:tetratricopeptide (TPR) repeat protein
MVKVAHDNFELQFAQNQYDQALNYLSTLKPIYGSKLPAAILADFAITYEKLGDNYTTQAHQLQNTASADSYAAEENHKAFQLANQEAALQYGRSGDYFYDHALAVTIADDNAHGNSLWQAGQNYDKAQLWNKAIDSYREFARVRSNDPRFVLAINHLGLAYQADGQYKMAYKLFEELIEKHPKSEAALASLVPMAQCMIEMGESEQAKRTLEYVLNDNKAITPEGDTYRAALIELGKLHFMLGEYLPAITKLEEAIDEKRYGNSEQSPILRYRLAEAYRLSVGDLNKTLADPMPQAKRMELQKQRIGNLDRAGVLYSQTINQFEARNAKTLTPLETTYFRNAYFYRGDCAYDLAHWDDAIKLYDLAAKKWENHPASLVALVQIVNAYCEQGAMQEAKAANDRARYQLKRIPDAAFKDPSMPMGRKHWEDWLRWSNELDLFASSKKP